MQRACWPAPEPLKEPFSFESFRCAAKASKTSVKARRSLSKEPKVLSGAAQLGEQAKTVPRAMHSVHLRLVARITKVGLSSKG